MNPTDKKKKKLRKHLDTLIQHKYVPLNPECLVCCNPTSEMHHFFPKSTSLYLRWNINNLINLCRSCHFRHHKQGDPVVHAMILKRKGQKWFDELERDRRIIFKYTLANLEEVKRMLET